MFHGLRFTPTKLLIGPTHGGETPNEVADNWKNGGKRAEVWFTIDNPSVEMERGYTFTVDDDI